MPADAAPSQPLPAVLEWFNAKSIRLSPKLRIGRIESESAGQEGEEAASGLGIFASSAIAAGEIVGTIPKSAILSKKSTSLAGSASYERFCQDAQETTPQPDVMILSTVILHELLLGQKSDWFGYLESLPTVGQIALPAFWKDSEAKVWLEGTDVCRVLQWQQSDEASLRSFFSRAVLPLFASRHASEFLHSTFQLAYAMVSSRAFYVDNYHGLSMVPLADIFNHHYEPHVCLQSDDVVCPTCGSFEPCEHDEESSSQDRLDTSLEQGESVEMLATANVEAGQEVFNTYGRLANAVLLANYGFLLSDNEDDRVCWYSVQDVLHGAGLERLDSRQIGMQWRQSLTRSYTHTNDARVSEAHEDEVQANQAVYQLCYIDADADVSHPLWLLLASLMQHLDSKFDLNLAKAMVLLCEHRLSALHGSDLAIENILDHAEGAISSIPVRLAIRQVIAERTLLTACREKWKE